jgi:hypothetical protein
MAKSKVVYVGDIVIYHTNKEDKQLMRNAQANIQDHLPAIVVAVWSPTCLNLRVIGDGNYFAWKTSIANGTTESTWSFKS